MQNIDDSTIFAKLTEGRCTGIPKIISAMLKNGSPEPIFETDDERTYFLTTLPIHPFFINKENKGEVEGEVSNIELNATEIAILRAFKDEFESKKLIMNRAGYEKMSGFLNRIFATLIGEGFIEYMVPDKPKSSKQKYRITQRGKIILGSMKQ